MSQVYKDSVFWVDIDKVHPNPYQPRKEFNKAALNDLADSIKQYGVLQPMTVTKNEVVDENQGIVTRYELIAGERRLRASQIAGLKQVPVLIRVGDTDKVKLELAIIENLQREDLNPIDRALAFARLRNEFKLTFAQIGQKMGKSREYISNSIRLLQLSDDIKMALVNRQISEGHTRPLLMLGDRPKEQETLLSQIIQTKLSVRDAEKRARRIATDKARKYEDPTIVAFEENMSDTLGTKVSVKTMRNGSGRVVINFNKKEDLKRMIKQLEQGVNSIHDEEKTDSDFNSSVFSGHNVITEKPIVSTKKPLVSPIKVEKLDISRIFSPALEPYERSQSEFANPLSEREIKAEENNLRKKYQKVFSAVSSQIENLNLEVDDFTI